MKNLTSLRFGRLVVLERAGNATRGHGVAWLCRCDCGGETVVVASSLQCGATTSCGCFGRQCARERARLRFIRHGATADGKRSHEYDAWDSAKKRCFNPRHAAYRYYGGRGITMCEEWRSSFEAFLAHIGPCPPGLTLDRIDNNGNYEPGNVRWATWKQQVANRRPCVKRALEALGA